MKTKYWVMIIAAIFVLCLGLSIWLLMPGTPAGAVEVYSDGVLIHTLPLSRDAQITVTAAHGTNVVTVRDGKVAVTQADCPDGHCMARGFCDSGVAIVCLPNRLVLEFSGAADVDMVVG